MNRDERKSLDRASVAIFQLSSTLCWLVEQIARRDRMTLAQAAQKLALEAPRPFMAHALAITEKAFRSRGV